MNDDKRIKKIFDFHSNFVTPAAAKAGTGIDRDYVVPGLHVAEAHLGALSVFYLQGELNRLVDREARRTLLSEDNCYFVLLPEQDPSVLSGSPVIGDRPSDRNHFPYIYRWTDVHRFIYPSSARSAFVIRIPQQILRRRVPFIDRLCGTVASVEAANSVARMIVEAVFRCRVFSSKTQLTSLDAIVLDAIDILASEIESAGSFSSRRGCEYARVRVAATRHIETNLADYQMDCGTVANHCGVSVRYLHMAFKETEVTVTSYIKEARMMRCQEDLRNRAFSRYSVKCIGMKWGFASASSFSRAYRDHFGRSPSEDRRQ